jgi:hypothetical protein
MIKLEAWTKRRRFFLSGRFMHVDLADSGTNNMAGYWDIFPKPFSVPLSVTKNNQTN